ncbi:MAG: hypothetical protein GF350_11425 [Chitinivibrionales bacterium]|nr:hypothetical protein [Chitinivibrionales bacterium]
MTADSSSKIPFSLKPFEPCTGYSICGLLKYNRASLSIKLQINGNIDALVIPALSSRQQRISGLWEHTCFELFIQDTNERGYREFNVSPSGDWDGFTFSDYRAGMKELEMNDAPVVHIERNSGCFSIDATISPVNLSSVHIGCSTVLEHAAGPLWYWALAHGKAKPDFHDAGCRSIHINCAE